MQLPGASIVLPHFGSYDCRCAAHLIGFAGPAKLPSLHAFAALVGDQSVNGYKMTPGINDLIRAILSGDDAQAELALPTAHPTVMQWCPRWPSKCQAPPPMPFGGLRDTPGHPHTTISLVVDQMMGRP